MNNGMNSSSVSRETILVVDDDPESIIALAECLDRYRVRVAKTGEAAVQMVQSDSPPDLITLDVSMPGLDGYETCRRIKATENGRDIPVIFLSAKTRVEDEILGFQSGAVDYMQKPLSARLVQARVATHLELRRARRALQLQNQVLLDRARVLTEMERIINHDLRNGLMVVLSVPERLLVEPDLSSHQRRSLEIIAKAAQKMAGLLNQSNEFWRLEQGTLETTYRSVALRGLWHEVLDGLQGPLDERRVLISGREEMADVWVNGDDTLLYSLLVNLMKNAIEAAPLASVIQIALEEEAGWAKVTIGNEGAIPAAIRERFFEKDITHGKAGGTGLGTYTAALITQAHSGHIEAEVFDESRTRVCVRLPRLPRPN